jgi:hypothetical protein
MEQTLVFGIQPSRRLERGLPEIAFPGSCVSLAFAGAFLRDRAKGNGSVALDPSWWLIYLGGRVSRLEPQCGHCYCDGKSALIQLKAGSICSGVARIPVHSGPGSPGLVHVGTLSGARLWCLVCYPSDPS